MKALQEEESKSKSWNQSVSVTQDNATFYGSRDDSFTRAKNSRKTRRFRNEREIVIPCMSKVRVCACRDVRVF